MNFKVFKKLGQIIVYFIVFFFIGKILKNHWDDISIAIKQMNIVWALLSLLFITLSLTFQGYIWHKLLKSINRNVQFKDSFVTYFRSLITRYIPGGIWVFIARTYVTTKIGLSKQQSLYLIVIESVLAVLSGSIIFIIIQPNTPYNIYLNLLGGIIILFSLIFLFTPNKIINLFNSIFRKKIHLIPIKWLSILTITLLFFIQWFIIGVGIYFFCLSFIALPLSSLLSLTGIFAISWVIGFIVIITPSGFGVREIIFIALLITILSLPIAIIIALLVRILFIFGEVINFLISTSIKLPE